MTFMPNEASRWATSTPIRPSPTMPTVFSYSSVPLYLLRFHSPPLSAAFAGAMLRAVAKSSPMASSAALVMLDVGALTTMTPAWVAALTSTLSSPTPARAMTFSLGAAAIASASTFVALRTRMASASAMADSRAGRSVPSTSRISNSGPRASTVAGESCSAMSTTGLLTWDSSSGTCVVTTKSDERDTGPGRVECSARFGTSAACRGIAVAGSTGHRPRFPAPGSVPEHPLESRRTRIRRMHPFEHAWVGDSLFVGERFGSARPLGEVGIAVGSQPFRVWMFRLGFQHTGEVPAQLGIDPEARQQAGQRDRRRRQYGIGLQRIDVGQAGRRRFDLEAFDVDAVAFEQ